MPNRLHFMLTYVSRGNSCLPNLPPHIATQYKAPAVQLARKQLLINFNTMMTLKHNGACHKNVWQTSPITPFLSEQPSLGNCGNSSGLLRNKVRDDVTGAIRIGAHLSASLLLKKDCTAWDEAVGRKPLRQDTWAVKVCLQNTVPSAYHLQCAQNHS